MEPFYQPLYLLLSITKRIPLKNPSSTDFEFQIDFSQKHEAFTVFPTYGRFFPVNRLKLKSKQNHVKCSQDY